MLGTDRPLGPVRDTQEGSMNDVTVTVSGFAGNDPTLYSNGTKNREWTTFRVASTRRYVNENGEWTDGATLWFTVKAWRQAALNVVRSVRKGVPVVVTGRLEVDEWTGADGQQRTGLVVNASAIGVDATRGRVEFMRVVHQGTPPGETPGAPVDDGELVATRPGDADPFALDVLTAEGDVLTAEDTAGSSGGGQRELVNA